MSELASLSASASPGRRETPVERRKVEELKQRDAEVKRSEQQHQQAAGPYAKVPPNYEYVTGPDGKRYAVAREVGVDTSEVPGDPEATLRKAHVIKQIAQAPWTPFVQGQQVAIEAERIERQARREIEAQEEARAKAAEDTPETDPLAPRFDRSI